MSDVILHSYDESPFTQRALRLLGIKGLSWRWVKTPMAPPKEALVKLTGGYRGTPVMQIGADIYIDTQMIAAELERRYPEPTFFPAGDCGLAYLQVKFADAFFLDSMSLVAKLMSPHFPDAFREDREHVFSKWGFDALAESYPQAGVQLRAQAKLLNDQLADGRPFLTGDRPGLMDVQAFSVPWFVRGSLSDVADVLWSGLEYLPPWEARVAAIGEGTRTAVDSEVALEEAKASHSVAQKGVMDNDPEGLAEGMEVIVTPLDTRRGAVKGRIVSASENQVAVRHSDEGLGGVVVHFPRLNYAVRADK